MKRVDFALKQKLYECDKHKEKILDAKEFLKPIMPLTLEKYQNLTKIESSFIDQLNFRFSKLQDSMGSSIFKSLLILSKEDVKMMTFLDILNRLEELGVLKKDMWLNLREVRNEIAHEYSFNQEEVVDNINMIYNKSDNLLEIYENVKNFLKIKFNIEVKG